MIFQTKTLNLYGIDDMWILGYNKIRNQQIYPRRDKEIPMRRKIILIIASMVLIFSLYQIITKQLEYRRNAEDYRQVRELFYDDFSEELFPDLFTGTGDDGGSNGSSFNRESLDRMTFEERENFMEKIHRQLRDLQEVNPHVVGWIRVSGTEVDYPVVQGRDNEFYLHHNVQGNYNAGGAIYMDFRNDPRNFDLNTVIYGHQMRDGSMFTSINQFQNESFFHDNGSILYFSEKGITVWEVYSVYITDANSYYIMPDFSTEEEQTAFIQHTLESSKFTTEAEIAPEDRIITLSTCNYTFDDARLAVHGKLTGSFQFEDLQPENPREGF